MKFLFLALVLVSSAAAAQFAPEQIEASIAGMGGAYYSGEELFRRGKDAFAIGYVTAVYDSDLTSQPVGGIYCAPKGATNGQLVDVAWLYLERNPAKRHLHAVHLIRQSWRDAWPCSAKWLSGFLC